MRSELFFCELVWVHVLLFFPVFASLNSFVPVFALVSEGFIPWVRSEYDVLFPEFGNVFL